MKQRDIYWADLKPSKGKEQKGKRPVAIISGDALNVTLNIVICYPLTTSVKNYAGCVALDADHVNKLKN